MALVVAGRGGRLVVHDHLHTLLGGILVDGLDVEVGVGGHEVEDQVLLVAEPVLPALVPALDEHGVESVLGGKVDVLLHMCRVGGMFAVGLHLVVVGLAQFHAGDVVGVGPLAASRNHFPPDADVLRGPYPRRVLYPARLIQVQCHARGQDVGTRAAHDDGAPGRLAGCLQVALVAAAVGREPRLEGARPLVVVEVHGGVVDAGRLVQVDVEPVVGLQLEGRLHAGGAGGCLRGVGRDGGWQFAAYFRQARLGVGILLRVVVARNPPGPVVAGHGELGVLLADDEVGQVALVGELVAQGQTVVEEAEADENVAVVLRLVQAYGHLVVVVANLALLAPYGLPRFVERSLVHGPDREARHEVGLLVDGRGFGVLGVVEGFLASGLFPLQFQTQTAGADDCPSVEFQPVRRPPFAVQCKVHRQPSVGRLQRLGGEDVKSEE